MSLTLLKNHSYPLLFSPEADRRLLQERGSPSLRVLKLSLGKTLTPSVV